MNKMQMAHEWYMKHGKDNVMEKSIACAWQYADAMQAEADERNKAEAEQKRKEVREILNDANTFIEREAQHFDDVEWQPDWSQAPDEANMITIDACGVGQYWVMYQGSEPKLGDNRWFDDYRGRYLGGFEPVGFNGKWQDSLRKRPQ